jgi:RNA polymerase sigma factor (sigma-70 family)
VVFPLSNVSNGDRLLPDRPRSSLGPRFDSQAMLLGDARTFYNLTMDSSENDSQFKTTHWNLVVSSRRSDVALREQSLSELCRIYWYPLFAYLRRKGNSPDAAADFVQGFFLQLIDKSFLDAVEPEKGRFRWFLMSAVNRYVAKQHRQDRAIKRGGENTVFSLDVDDAEHRYQMEPSQDWTAEKLFDRRWALALLEQALRELEQQQKSKNRLELYQALQSTLTGIPMTGQQYEEIAARFSMSTGAVKVAALRLRERYRELLVQLVRQTVTDSHIVERELEELLAALQGR